MTKAVSCNLVDGTRGCKDNKPWVGIQVERCFHEKRNSALAIMFVCADDVANPGGELATLMMRIGNPDD